MNAVKRILLLGALVAAMLTVFAGSAAADEGWSITSFVADYTVNTDGSVAVVEDIQVDFGSLDKHGIYRDLFDRIYCATPLKGSEAQLNPCSPGSFRSYAMHVTSVAKADGKPWESFISDTGNAQRIDLPKRDLYPELTVRTILRQAGLSRGEIEAFIAGATKQ